MGLLLKIPFFICLFLLFLGEGVWAKVQKQKFTIATASAGGTYYPIGVGIATIASKKLSKSHNMFFSAVTSAGSVENIARLQKKEADFAIIQGLFGLMAWQGKAQYDGDVRKNLRAISMLWHEVEQFTIRSEYVKTGNIQDIKNLYGKKFSMGGRNSGARVSTEIILKSLGIEHDKMDLEYLGYSASANALVSGKIEGVNPISGAPTPAVCNMFQRVGVDEIQMLEFTKDDLDRINESYPIWTPYIIKAGTYPDQKKDIQTIAQPCLLVMTKNTSDESVYLLVKTIYEHLPYLHQVHKATKRISLNKATIGLPIPLHPGAVKYYQEQGIPIPKELMQ